MDCKQIKDCQFRKEGICQRRDTLKCKKDMEENKVEDKTIKVRCMKNVGTTNLTLGKEYQVVEVELEGYKIINDDESIRRYHKSLFAEVKEDTLMVECIWSDGTLECRKIYPIIREENQFYWILNDLDKEKLYSKDMFKPVPKEKEQKEYTLQEVFENIKQGETYIQNTIDKFSITKECGGIRINRLFEGDKDTMWINGKENFIKVEEPKPVSTVEAFKALEEGKTITSVLSNNQYKKYDKDIFASTIGCNEFHKCDLIYTNEMKNTWIIE